MKMAESIIRSNYDKAMLEIEKLHKELQEVKQEKERLSDENQDLFVENVRLKAYEMVLKQMDTPVKKANEIAKKFHDDFSQQITRFFSEIVPCMQSIRDEFAKCQPSTSGSSQSDFDNLQKKLTTTEQTLNDSKNRNLELEHVVQTLRNDKHMIMQAFYEVVRENAQEVVLLGQPKMETLFDKFIATIVSKIQPYLRESPAIEASPVVSTSADSSAVILDQQQGIKSPPIMCSKPLDKARKMSESSRKPSLDGLEGRRPHHGLEKHVDKEIRFDPDPTVHLNDPRLRTKICKCLMCRHHVIEHRKEMAKTQLDLKLFYYKTSGKDTLDMEPTSTSENVKISVSPNTSLTSPTSLTTPLATPNATFMSPQPVDVTPGSSPQMMSMAQTHASIPAKSPVKTPNGSPKIIPLDVKSKKKTSDSTKAGNLEPHKTDNAMPAEKISKNVNLVRPSSTSPKDPRDTPRKPLEIDSSTNPSVSTPDYSPAKRKTLLETPSIHALFASDDETCEPNNRRENKSPDMAQKNRDLGTSRSYSTDESKRFKPDEKSRKSSREHSDRSATHRSRSRPSTKDSNDPLGSAFEDLKKSSSKNPPMKDIDKHEKRHRTPEKRRHESTNDKPPSKRSLSSNSTDHPAPRPSKRPNFGSTDQKVYEKRNFKRYEKRSYQVSPLRQKSYEQGSYENQEQNEKTFTIPHGYQDLDRPQKSWKNRNTASKTSY